jgi:pyridoxal phosphate-dependent aminotransferase EpsN
MIQYKRVSLMDNRIWLSPPFWSGKEEVYIKKAIQDNWIAPGGPNIKDFEKRIAERVGRKYGTVVNSGTSALHLSLLSLGIGPGDLVYCPSFTFTAVINPVLYVGASPVLIDCLPGTWNLDPILLEKAIQDDKNRSGNAKSSSGKECLIFIHNYGMPSEVDPLLQMAEKYGLHVIEDAAEALGSTVNEIQAGQVGDISILSFSGNKVITASTGGAVLSDNQSLIEKTRYLASQAKESGKPYYHHEQIGFNYQLSNIDAGIGLGQLETLNERIEKKRSIFNYYKKNLRHLYCLTDN